MIKYVAPRRSLPRLLLLRATSGVCEATSRASATGAAKIPVRKVEAKRNEEMSITSELNGEIQENIQTFYT